MRDTLATQDAVFEAEKKILGQKQTKKKLLKVIIYLPFNLKF